jgi:20S proteasome alpha/beta subunit
VTIGIGFTCQNSIILCSDTQITYEGSHKRYEHKIFPIEKSNYSVGFSYAGDVGTAKTFCENFSVAMEESSVPVTVEMIRRTIISTLSKLKVPDNFNLLCGVVIPLREMKLFQSRGKNVHPVPSAFIGIADTSVLSYLHNLLAQSSSGTYSVRQAELLGRYMILQSKNWIDGCGGPTDVFIFHSDGRIEPSPMFPSGVEGHLEILERYFMQLSEAFVDARIPAEEFERRLDKFSQAMRKERALLSV